MPDEETRETPDDHTDPADAPETQASAPPSGGLGPFQPPTDFDHGEEFATPSPRPIPKKCRDGSYARKSRGVIWTLAALAVACFVFAPLPMVRELSYYVLVLQYLHWIGIGLAAIAAVIFLIRQVDPGKYRYVTEGIPVVGRIRHLGQSLQGRAQFQVFSLVADVEYHDPDTNELRTAQVETEQKFPLSDREKISCAVGPGDYVTLVGLPGRQFESSLRIYGFLGLDPEREFLQKNGKPMLGLSTMAILLIVVGIFAGLGLLVSGLYTIEFCFPNGGDWKVGIIPGLIGGVLGAIGGWLLVKAEERSEQPGTSGFERWILLLAGPLFGVLGGIVVLALLNAKLDQSPPDLQAVQIENVWEETWQPLFIRNYKIEYRLAGEPKTEKLPARLEHLRRFMDEEGVILADRGVIDIGQGRFGLTWIRGIYPLTWTQQDGKPDEGVAAVVLEITDPETGEITYQSAIPVIELEDGTQVPPPAELAEEEVARMQAVLNQFEMRTPKEGELELIEKDAVPATE